jgi:hypothetical protein
MGHAQVFRQEIGGCTRNLAAQYIHRRVSQVLSFGTWVLGCSTLSFAFASSKHKKAGASKTYPFNTSTAVSA